MDVYLRKELRVLTAKDKMFIPYTSIRSSPLNVEDFKKSTGRLDMDENEKCRDRCIEFRSNRSLEVPHDMFNIEIQFIGSNIKSCQVFLETDC